VTPLNIFHRNIHDTSFKLTKREGTYIKDEIKVRISTSFPWYCKNLGIQPSNFYSIMDGTRTCTIIQLNKILSGAGLIAILRQELVIQESETGPNAKNAHYQGQEGESPLEGMEEMDVYE